MAIRIFGPDGPTLAELGVDKNLAKRARKLAGVSEAEFEARHNRTPELRMSRITMGLPKTRRIAVTPMQWLARRGTAAVNVVGRIT